MTALALALSVLFVAAGVARAVVPRYFVGLVPTWLPARGAIVAVTGVADVVAGVLLAVPDTSQQGATLASALLAGYLVSHLDAARRAEAGGPLLIRPWAVALRVVVNLGYLVAAVVVAVR